MDVKSNLKDQVALVTGGGRGLGRAFAHALAAEGAAVSVTARTRNQFPYLGSYTISKTALTQYSNILANQLKGTGVSVFAYDPGFVRTYLTEVYGQAPEIHSSVRDMFKTGLEQGQDTPMKTAVRMFIFLASGKADALSGRCISVSDDESELLSRTEEILDKDLYTLRLNH